MSLVATVRPAAARVAAGGRLLGPAFVAAIAYVDPGNVATNITGGARYGYLLLWVVVAANLLAGLVQYLSAKVGLVTGRSLPELIADRLPGPLRWAFWLQAELVVVATDLAEVIGGAVGLRLLCGVPLLTGGVVTGVVSTLLLTVRGSGQQRFERLMTVLLLVVGAGFLAGLIRQPPDLGGTVSGLVPHLADTGSLLLAVGILGATVMPHAVYLHSALARDRHAGTDGPARRRALVGTRVDVGLAMLVAGSINAAMLLLAAAALGDANGTDDLTGAHAAIGRALGGGAALLFAVALLASGLASTCVGSQAGMVVMDGLLHRRLPMAVRRVVTLLPALVLLAVGLQPTTALLVSQVVLSFGIPFALVPLTLLASSRRLLGAHANHPATTALTVLVTAAVVALNAALIVLTLRG